MPAFQSISEALHSWKGKLVRKSCPFQKYPLPGLYVFLFVLAGLTFTTTSVSGKIRNKPRYRLEAAIGYGFPEATGIKFKYGNQFQAGLVQSFDTRGPGPTGIELYYHIGKKPRLMDQSPWYFSGGFSGYLFKVDYVKEYKYLVYPRAGRSFYFSRNAGINADIGPGFPLARNRNQGNPVSPVLFTGSLNIFIRF